MYVSEVLKLNKNNKAWIQEHIKVLHLDTKLKALRQQEYPLKLINDQFKRALTVNQDDLLLRIPASKKKRRSVIAPLVVTYNPGNPPFKAWTQEHNTVLQLDPKLKAPFPKIYVITRHNFGSL